MPFIWAWQWLKDLWKSRNRELIMKVTIDTTKIEEKLEEIRKEIEAQRG